MLRKIKIILLIVFLSLSSFSQTLDQDHTGTGTGYLSCEQISVNAQSFTSGLTGLLNEIKIDIEAQFCPFNPNLDTIAFVANVFNGNGTTGTLLASQLAVLNIPYTRNLFPIAFSTPASVTAGNQYTLELRVNFGQICDPPSIAINFVWFTAANNNYAGGQPYSSLSGSVTNDFYFQTYVASVSGIPVNAIDHSIAIFPNPVHDFISITSKNKTEKFAIEVIDIYGHILINEKLYQDKMTDKDLSELAQGIYLLKINSENGGRIVRFVKG